MEEFICTNVYVPLRKGPSHKAEMGSQILFGEKYCKTEKAGTWTKIKINLSSYSGWIDNNQMIHTRAGSGGPAMVITRKLTVTKSDGSTMSIEPGSEIYKLSEDRKSFQAGGITFTSAEEVMVAPEAGTISETALRFLNVPYLWGGRTTGGMDCSGLTQIVCKLHGIRLPRDSFEQAERGATIDFIDDAQPGDLLFFDNEAGKISHVGLLLEPGKIIHCSGKVRIDKIDHQGIYREDLKRYSHHLRIIKRVWNRS